MVMKSTTDMVLTFCTRITGFFNRSYYSKNFSLPFKLRYINFNLVKLHVFSTSAPQTNITTHVPGMRFDRYECWNSYRWLAKRRRRSSRGYSRNRCDARAGALTQDFEMCTVASPRFSSRTRGSLLGEVSASPGAQF